ncbi:MAG TPA: hypothetical protein VIC08_03720 [Cellvibrionaceae bacterium]
MTHPARFLPFICATGCLILSACSHQQNPPDTTTTKTQSKDERETQHCIMIYQPVCALTGTSGRGSQPLVYKTFSNSCFATIEQARIAFEDECGKLEGKPESGR